ncbi:MAG: protein-methionine-sulfoxide reductase heme-binding subunit MsrQ [Rhodobacteraceae bacterium]|nr:protein-methionine-sulfoxide reductase heme-binding subunit MsrQ [Paracoccaceae bacterium]MCY4195982.1 protein-methionine-sulfoxide reductase heme-binding subunit MsrQ [Paracoccaceae bacterium]MCY4327351.1 protein-methionine-sulfoxide reductase heme-binding subunit MsrQ [Paracoccaceae bacterium]
MTAVQRVNGIIRRVPGWPIYLLFPLPGIWLFWRALNNQLGANPIEVLEHEYGELGLQLIIVTLLITPLRRWTHINLLSFRRAIGVMAFVYVLAHVLTWLLLDHQLDLQAIWTEIVKRPYITIGMVGFLALLPLALTSNNLSVRKLGPLRWRKLHRLAYLAAFAGAAHYLLLVKAWPIEPIIYAAVVAALLGMRLYWKMSSQR